jgi:pimeloyl-ACP methyl ester carboxylesterase
VPRLVHADWMLAVPSEPYMDVIRQLDSDEWAQARDTLFTIWAAGVDTPEIRRVLEVMNRHGEEMWRRSGREIGASYAENVSPFEAFQRLDPPVPVLHLYGQPQDPAYLELQERFAGEHDWFAVRKLDATTHFAMIETDAEVADAIEEFVTRP